MTSKAEEPSGLGKGLPRDVWEVLRADGGWLTVYGLMMDFPDKPIGHVRRSLLRLRARGLAVNRPHPLNEARNGFDPHEWRAVLPTP